MGIIRTWCEDVVGRAARKVGGVKMIVGDEEGGGEE